MYVYHREKLHVNQFSELQGKLEVNNEDDKSCWYDHKLIQSNVTELLCNS